MPGDGGDDHDDDEGAKGAEEMVVKLESTPELERGGEADRRGRC